MKAKVKATGEIVDVYERYNDFTGEVRWEELYATYSADELDFDVPQDTPEEVTIEGWVARDEDGALNLFDREPERIAECAWAYYPGHTLGFSLPKESFPEVTWVSEPLHVKLTITAIV